MPLQSDSLDLPDCHSGADWSASRPERSKEKASQFIINYVGMNSEFHFLLDSKDTESECSHTAEYLKEDFTFYIEKYKDQRAGGVTDNTSANRSMWRELSSNFRQLFFYGCNCHNTHLLVSCTIILRHQHRQAPLLRWTHFKSMPLLLIIPWKFVNSLEEVFRNNFLSKLI
jgi:uncharacterized protein YcsI (UPF0317 family)